MDKTIKSLETLDTTISTLIDGAPEKGAKLVDWLYVQVPDVAEQLLTWHMFESGIHTAVNVCWIVVLAFTSFIGTRFLYKWAKENDRFDEPAFIFPVVIINVVVFICICVNCDTIVSNLDWLKIWLAPKVYLLEYLGGFVK